MSYNIDTGMYEGYIYKVTNQINNHMYIGQTMRTIDIRWKEHIKNAVAEVDDYYFHRAIRKYNKENFVVDQIEIVCSKTLSELKFELNKLERHYINIFNTYNPCGYNGVPGGEGASVRPIDYYSLDKVFVCQFDSMTAASEYTGLSMTSITENCNGTSSGTRCGFFRYVGDRLDKFETLYRYNGAFRVNKFNLDGEIVETYRSCKDIQDEYGVTQRIALRWKDKHTLIDREFVFFSENEEFDYDKVTVPYVAEIDVFNLNNEYICTFPNQSEAGRALGLNSSSISKCCLGKISHVKDFIFRKNSISF